MYVRPTVMKAAIINAYMTACPSSDVHARSAVCTTMKHTAAVHRSAPTWTAPLTRNNGKRARSSTLAANCDTRCESIGRPENSLRLVVHITWTYGRHLSTNSSSSSQSQHTASMCARRPRRSTYSQQHNNWSSSSGSHVAVGMCIMRTAFDICPILLINGH